MKLSEYIAYDDRYLSVPTLAKLAGINHATLYNLMKGMDVKCSTLFKLEKACKGKVKAKEIYDEYIAPKKK